MVVAGTPDVDALSHALDRATLWALYAEHKNEREVQTKRLLWARLLETALGPSFEESDELFLQHTLIVHAATIIAHAVVGFEVESVAPASLLSGAKLEEAGVLGVVEGDFFCWVVDSPNGDVFVRTLARRLGRFDWSAVDHDVLKVLYASVIPAEVRKKLGEHYTPDWLAQKVVHEVITDPLEDRALDPACGSGTFLFHAVRRYLAEAEAKRTPVAARLDGLTSHIFGMDLHPVAVTLARVTYLLAIGRKRLGGERGVLRVPVYLGDAMQWRLLKDAGARTWLSRIEGRVDVLVGNPPWLSYRFMPEKMQDDFRARSEARGLWRGARVATQQDLSGLFVARTIQLYLMSGGRFGFVMPSAVLDRDQFAGLRAGKYDDSRGEVRVELERPWDLRRLRPHFFPVGAAVVFGKRSGSAGPMPSAVESWSGRVPGGNASWAEVAEAVQRKVVEPAPRAREAEAPYRARFRNGATMFPRLLFLVEKKRVEPLGQVAGEAMIQSVRSAYEKKPWKDLPGLEGSVEARFLRPVHLGETVLPYRVLAPSMAVVPRDEEGLLDAQNVRLERYPGLGRWWHAAEQCWNEHRSSQKLTLSEQLNYHGKLERQFRIQPQRVVYAKAGMHLAAARLCDRRAVVDHKLYWATATTVTEAHYLCAILNSAAATRLVRPLMSYGKDPRDIDKTIWRLPIPLFDPGEDAHVELAALGQQAEAAIAGLSLDGDKHFSAARRLIRRFLEESEVGQQIEGRVKRLVRRVTGACQS